LDPYAGITRIRFNGYNLRPLIGTTPLNTDYRLNGDIVKPPLTNQRGTEGGEVSLKGLSFTGVIEILY